MAGFTAAVPLPCSLPSDGVHELCQRARLTKLATAASASVVTASRLGFGFARRTKGRKLLFLLIFLLLGQVSGGDGGQVGGADKRRQRLGKGRPPVWVALVRASGGGWAGGEARGEASL